MSRSLEDQAPAAALAVYPLNAEARLRLALDELETGGATPSELAARIEDALPYNVGDARFYSLLGVLAQRYGDQAAGERLFDQALLLSKAEQNAQTQKIFLSARRGDYAAVVDHADVLLRRWAGRFDDISGALAAAFMTPVGYKAIMAKLEEGPPWRASFLWKFAAATGAPGILQRAILELRASRYPPSTAEINFALDAFFKSGDSAAAYRLFLFTLTDEERKLAGPVYDSAFVMPPSGKRFDWRIKNSKGVEISLPATDGGAVVQFEDQPVAEINFGQSLALFPGRYRVAILASGQNLTIPRPLFLLLKCSRDNAELARIELQGGSYAEKRLDAEAEVPVSGCEAQDLSLGVNPALPSWNQRFSGSLALRSVAVERPPP